MYNHLQYCANCQLPIIYHQKTRESFILHEGYPSTIVCNAKEL